MSAERSAPRAVLRRACMALAVSLFAVIATGCASLGMQPQTRIAGLSAAVDLESSFQQVIDQAMPSVVSLRVQRRAAVPVATIEDDGASRPLMSQSVTVVNGSGMVISPDGLILTNDHVVQGADRIDVIFSDADARTDLAILSCGRTGLTPVRFCDAQNLHRGQWSIAIGNPLGIGRDGQLSASVGVISNVSRDLPGLGEEDDRRYVDMVQTTAPISPGNSGGPLFNLQGEVIGVVTAMYVRNGSDEGLAFAIPVSQRLRRTLAELLQGNPIDYGYLGLTVRDFAEGEVSPGGDVPGTGVLVIDLDSAGPAARSGLQIGDAIVAYAGEPVRTAAMLVDRVERTPVGTPVSVEFLRNGERKGLTIRAARREARQIAALR
jgi:serine protease Do